MVYEHHSYRAEDIVIQWTQNVLGLEKVARIQSDLDNRLNILDNPPIITLNLPWHN